MIDMQQKGYQCSGNTDMTARYTGTGVSDEVTIQAELNQIIQKV
jgi:hypothetical protein